MKGEQLIPLFVAAGAKHKLPPAYLYALAGRESGWDPSSKEPTGATGLFQITGVTLKDFNAGENRSLTKRDMLDARLNTEVASWYLANVVRRLYPVDFDVKRDVVLFTYLWNAGPFAGARLVAELQSRGVAHPTAEQVHELAKSVVSDGGRFRGLKADAYKWFARRKPSKFAVKVADLYRRSLDSPNFRVAPLRAVAGALGRLLHWLRHLFF